ncbi:hypothetical protein A2U01_0073352 [Trifolium medium]|uniref:Uncharacterized protein n=1 Tax=Trifolium medium TaxID=97028 RepID=A0A392STC5_9FABA|nr:hypothetical protein [Trifolium medium]
MLPTIIGILDSSTSSTTPSSASGVFFSVLPKKRLHPNVLGFYDSPTSYTTPLQPPDCACPSSWIFRIALQASPPSTL